MEDLSEKFFGVEETSKQIRKDHYREYRREYQREYRQQNRDRLLQKMRLYYQQNRDRILQKDRLYYQQNKDRLQGIFTRQCPNCGKELKYTTLAKWKRALKKKTKCRRCNALTQLHIGKVCVDKGAPEWFQIMSELGYNFIQNYRLKELGYFADGYDPEKHIWMEYDTKYHLKKHVKLKDDERQQRIIKYFESIGNPLNEFVRVFDHSGRFGISIIYRQLSTAYLNHPNFKRLGLHKEF